MLSLSISKPQHPNTAVSHRHGSLTRQDRARKEPRDGAVAQMGERCNRTAEVRGSNPLSSTKDIWMTNSNKFRRLDLRPECARTLLPTPFAYPLQRNFVYGAGIGVAAGGVVDDLHARNLNDFRLRPGAPPS